MVELIKVPKAIFRQTGFGEGIDKLMNDFFINTKEYVQSKLKESEDCYFEIKSASLTYSLGDVPIDRIKYVLYKKYVIAGMLETTDIFSDLQFTFFRDLSCLEKKVN
jgi:hypothetical protein